MSELLPENQYDQWDGFVKQARGGTLFHESWYLRALSDRLSIVVLRDGAGRIEAGMALTPTRFLGAAATRRPSYTPYNGPLIRPSAKANASEAMSEEKNRMVRLLGQSPRMGMYDFILSPDFGDTMPFLWNGFDVTVGYTYQIPPAGPEPWQSAMSSGHRRDLRKAGAVLQDCGALLETSDDLESCRSVLLETARLKGFKEESSWEAMRAWWQEVVAHNAGRVYRIRQPGQEPLCASLLVWDRCCGYYLASGMRGDVRHGPMNLLGRLLIDRMIQDSHRQGLTFDFEGSVLPGVEPYFRGWGGKCVPKCRAVKIPNFCAHAIWSLHRYWKGHRKRTGDSGTLAGQTTSE